MPKVVIDDIRGLVQEGGSGIDIKSAGLAGVAHSVKTSAIRTGAGIAAAMTVAVPANALIVDAGALVTTAVAASGNTNFSVRVGTGADGQQIAAAANLIGASTAAAAGVAISTTAAGQGAANIAFAADAPVHSTAARTIHITARSSANNITGGVLRGFVRYVVL